MAQIKVKSVEDLQSKTIDWLRFPLIIAVVFIHMNPVVDIQQINYQSISSKDIYNIVYILGSHVITHIAVPCFFLFSGFLFFYKLKEWNKSIYLKKLKSRTKTLIIPYLLWNLIPIFVFSALKIMKSDGSIWLYFRDLLDNGVLKIFWNYHEWGSDRTNFLGWLTPMYGPLNLPLWFLRDLIVMVFLSPLVYYFVKHTKHYGIILLWVLYYTKIWFVTPGFSITALFFFSLGAYFSIHDKNMVIALRKGKIIWLVIAFIAMMLSAFYDGDKIRDYFFSIYVVSGVISIINITSLLMKRGHVRVIDSLSKASFFIYVTHPILILGLSGKAFDMIFKSHGYFALTIRYFTVPLLCISVCLCIYCIMKRFTPKILNILMGNRLA